MRAIVIDPYDHTISEIDYDEGFETMKEIIGTPPTTTDPYDGSVVKAGPCRMITHSALGGGIHAYLDDEGNWTQEAWFRLGEVKVLYCGRMLLVGTTFDGEDAELPAQFTTTVAASKVQFMDDDPALRFAAELDALVAEEMADKPDVIHLDEGLAERIAEVVQRKRDRLMRLEGEA